MAGLSPDGKHLALLFKLGQEAEEEIAIEVWSVDHGRRLWRKPCDYTYFGEKLKGYGDSSEMRIDPGGRWVAVSYGVYKTNG